MAKANQIGATLIIELMGNVYTNTKLNKSEQMSILLKIAKLTPETENLDNPVVQEILAKVVIPEEKIAELKAKLGEGLRSEFDNASAKLDDVESIFLDPKVLALTRDDAAWTSWLNNANAVLGIAVMAREHVERLVAKFGSGVR